MLFVWVVSSFGGCLSDCGRATHSTFCRILGTWALRHACTALAPTSRCRGAPDWSWSYASHVWAIHRDHPCRCMVFWVW